MWSSPVQISAPASEPVALADAKQFVSIDAGETEFDSLISGFIETARQQGEAVTGTRFVSQVADLRADEWGDLCRLPIAPVLGIVEIEYLDSDGAEQLVDPADYELFGAGLMVGIRTAFGKGWPNGLRRVSGAIRVRLTLGYDPLPRPIKTALLIMVADLFAHRESSVPGSVSNSLSSMQVDTLLANYRMWL